MHNNISKVTMSKESLYHTIFLKARENIYTSYIRGKRCSTETDFFKEVSASLQFPYYFGENWRAFDECITDLDWLCCSGIFIVFDDYSKMFGGDEAMQSTLLKYLEGACEYWSSNNFLFQVWLNN